MKRNMWTWLLVLVLALGLLSGCGSRKSESASSMAVEAPMVMDAAAEAEARMPLVYNGDLFTPDGCRAFEQAHPATRALMLGRGMLANPALAQTYAGGAPLSKATLRAFHDDLLRAYQDAYPASVVLGRMREVAKNIACCFEGAEKPLKAARKAGSLSAYQDAVTRLFEDYALSANPCFSARS